MSDNPEVSVVPTRETAPERIFLQPECSVDPYGEGRQWCEDDVWEECGKPGCECKAVRYVREDLAHQTPPATQPIATVGEVEQEGAQAVAALVIRLNERQKIMWSAPDKDGGIHQLVDGADLLGAIYALSAYAHHLATLHTPPPVATATVGEVEMTPADHEAFDALYENLPSLCKSDRKAILQALARHRLAATPTPPAGSK